MIPAVKAYLEKNNIKYKLHLHPAVFTVKESSKIIGTKIPGLRTKSLFLKDENNKFYLVWMPGLKRLDIKKLKLYLRVKELHFSSALELKSELGIEPGSVSPLGILNSRNTKLIVDEEVMKAPIVDFHPNINAESLEVDNESVIRLYKSFKCEKEILEL